MPLERRLQPGSPSRVKPGKYVADTIEINCKESYCFSLRSEINLFTFHGSVIQLKQEVWQSHTLCCVWLTGDPGWCGCPSLLTLENLFLVVVTSAVAFAVLGSGFSSYKSKMWDYNVRDFKCQKGPVEGMLPSEVYKGAAVKFLSA